MVANGSIEEQESDALRGAGDREIALRMAEELRRADAKLVAFVQRRPLATLGAAALVGYLAGRVITRLH